MTAASPPAPPRHMAAALIIDDHPLFCDALAMTLQTFIGIARIDTAGRLDLALTHLQNDRPDVIVLDLNLPDVNGMDGLARLTQAAGDVPVIVVSSMCDDRTISSALRAGATGFVPKHSQREVYRQAFDAVARGQSYLPEGYVAADPQTEADPPMARLRLLTRQQAKILQLICAGKMNKQIAFDLSIAEATVKAHVTAIMRKLGVYSRTQAVLLARDVDFATLLPEG